MERARYDPTRSMLLHIQATPNGKLYRLYVSHLLHEVVPEECKVKVNVSKAKIIVTLKKKLTCHRLGGGCARRWRCRISEAVVVGRAVAVCKVEQQPIAGGLERRVRVGRVYSECRKTQACQPYGSRHTHTDTNHTQKTEDLAYDPPSTTKVAPLTCLIVSVVRELFQLVSLHHQNKNRSTQHPLPTKIPYRA